MYQGWCARTLRIMSTRVVLVVGGVIAALLVVVVIVGVVLVNTLNAQAERQAYEDCMARHGFAADEYVDPVSTGDELDAWADAIGAAVEACMD